MILLGGLVVRLWGVGHGLPFVYNLDEGSHFVKVAVHFFGEGYNPHYFQNPPAFSYFLHLVFTLGYGGIWPVGAGTEIKQAFAQDPTDLYEIGRATAGVFGVATAGVLYFIGKRLYGVGTGLIAAALMSYSFLPVHYSHLALNDIPTLLPLVIALLGTILIYERGDWTGYLVAGVGLGLATATKYTAAAIVVPVVLAYLLRVRADRSRMKPEFIKLVGAAAISLAAFVVANPFSLLAPKEFAYYVHRQQRFSGEIAKLGIDDTTGWQYYAWTLTWGFGWIPSLLAAIGAVFAWRKDWRRAILLLSFVVIFWFFMGNQMRFYGRWLLPIYPFLAVFAGYGVMRLAGFVPARWRTAAAVAITAAALVQPLVSVIHNNQLLTRTDTREQARNWLLANLPAGESIAVEQIASPGFSRVREDRAAPHIWRTYVTNRKTKARVEQYVLTLSPALLDEYARRGFCVVVSGSTQRGRAEKERGSKLVKDALAYYNDLDTKHTKVASFSPMDKGKSLPKFNFDISYNAYPLAFHRPGPQVDIYKLNNGACAGRRIFSS